MMINLGERRPQKGIPTVTYSQSRDFLRTTSRELDGIACAGISADASFQEVGARKQADDVACLAASKHQIVYAHLRPRPAILDIQHEIIFHRDELVPCFPSPILTQWFSQRQFRYELYPAHLARSDV